MGLDEPSLAPGTEATTMSIYQVAKRGITDLHRLIRQGLGEGLQAQEIRDGLERPLLSLTARELAKLGRFGDRLDRIRSDRPLAQLAVLG